MSKKARIIFASVTPKDKLFFGYSCFISIKLSLVARTVFVKTRKNNLIFSFFLLSSYQTLFLFLKWNVWFGELSIREMSVRENTRSGKCHLENCPSEKCPLRKLSIQENVFGKLSTGEMVVGENFARELSVGELCGCPLLQGLFIYAVSCDDQV